MAIQGCGDRVPGGWLSGIVMVCGAAKNTGRGQDVVGPGVEAVVTALLAVPLRETACGPRGIIACGSISPLRAMCPLWLLGL